MKFYYRDQRDRRDRRGTEWAALEFLQQHDQQAIARPLATSSEGGFTCFELIEGEPVPSEQVAAPHIDAAVAFLLRLQRLKSSGAHLPAASEACFSCEQIAANLQLRLQRLTRIPDVAAKHPQMWSYLNDELIPAIERFSQAARELVGGESGFCREIPPAQRTLSPSDFGFHNAVRRPCGELVFVDFEYFGWDDPAKTIVDFVLHPGMNLSINLRRRFVEAMLEGLRHIGDLGRRVQAVRPLFAAKWCLILLNEFLPDSLKRRGFASTTAIDETQAQARQLAKAKDLLRRIVKEDNDVDGD